MTADRETMQRYEITMQYLNNQTPEQWKRHTLDVMNEARLIVDDDIETEALGVLRASYWRSVRSYADEIVRDAIKRADEITDRDDWLDQTGHEYADGSQWVIYTWRAYVVLLASNHVDEYTVIGRQPWEDTLDHCVTIAAYLALKADLLDEVARLLDEAENADDGE